MNERDLLTVTQVAARCAVSERTVWRWIDSGKLPVIQVGGGAVRIDWQDVLDLKAVRKE